MTSPNTMSRTTNEPVLRRVARAALTRAVRGRSEQGSPWGEAVIGEFEETEGAWAAVRWALGGIRVARGERHGVARSTPLTVRSQLVRLGLVLAAVAAVTAAVSQFAVTTTYIASESMAPTMQIGDRFLVDRVAFHVTGVERGDTVVVEYPHGDGETVDVAKRVIGLGGDRIECRDGRLFRNGGALDEPYLAHQGRTECASVTVPSGKVFLLGDNRELSMDSRQMGAFAEGSVLGRVIGRAWPVFRPHPAM